MLRTSDDSLVGAEQNPWYDRTVAQMLDQTVAERPDSTALVEGPRRLSFAEMQRRRDLVGAALGSLGVQDGTHVAVLMTKGVDYTVLLHALWLVGAVAVPLNTMWTPDELERALSETDAELLVIGAEVGSLDADPVLGELGLPREGAAARSGLPRLRRVVRCMPGGDLDLSDAVRQGTPGSTAAGSPARSSRQESLFLFTSGSSSTPKAVVLRQDGLLGTADYFFQSLGLQDTDRFLSLGPYFHAGGIVQMLGCNLTGATQYVFPRVDVPTVARTAVEERCTAVTGFDPVLSKIFAAIGDMGEELPFRAVGCSPGVEVYDILRSRGIVAITMFAMTEGGNMITLASADDESFAHGRPLPGVDVRICDPSGAPVAPGEDGEICFKGWNLFRGYYNRESGSSARFATDDEDFFHTGDIGRLEADGRLQYLGRYSSMIKTAGENVSATEVENFLIGQVPEVVTAAVVGVPSVTWGEAVVAFVELTADSRPFDESWLKAACRGKLAGYKIPKRFVQMRAGDWPVADTGKLVRTRLAKHVDDEALAGL